MELIRGDTISLKFQRKTQNQEVITEKPDKMYFTVKNSYKHKEVRLQKSLTAGTIIYNEEDNYYYMTIEPEDTNDLNYGTYVYDIEVIVGNIVKTIAIGELKITKEVTFAENEV